MQHTFHVKISKIYKIQYKLACKTAPTAQKITFYVNDNEQHDWLIVHSAKVAKN